MRKIVTGLVGAAAVMASSLVMASSFKSGEITVVSPFPPGGGTDTLTRMVTSEIAEQQGWTIIVENKPGAGGNLALSGTARAKPDGKSLVMAQTDNIVLNPWLYKSLSYDTFKDFTPIGLVATSPSVFVVPPTSPYHTVEELIAAAKKAPGKITLGIPGVGSSGDLLGRLWQQQADMEISHIPYRGWGQASPDLLSGRIDMYTGSVASLLPHITSGAVRALAVASAERSPSLPDVPTFEESGVTGLDKVIWWGIMAPGNTPEPLVTELNSALNQALTSPDLIQRLEEAGYKVYGGTPTELDERHKADSAIFGKIIQEAGIQPQ